jgi:murein L,D-transpeptidase YcbB/YkuD
VNWSRTVLFGAALVASAGSVAGQDPTAEIQALVDSGELPGARRPSLAQFAAPLSLFYAGRGDSAAWLDAGVVTHLAIALVDGLARARDEGLDPRDYDVLRLERLIRQSAEGQWSDSAQAHFDVLLTVALMRYVHDVHEGRIARNPFSHHAREDSPAHDLAVIATSFRNGGSLDSLIAEVRPHLAQYRELRAELHRYRQLAVGAHPMRLPWRSPVRPGGSYAALPELKARLILLGDLDADSAALDDTLYAGPVVEAVRRFQSRHALAVDGVLGAGTIAELRIPISARITQIELSLERLRWLPPFQTRRAVVVNVPAFELMAFDSAGAGVPSLQMKVVTGSSFDTRTPVMLDQLRYIEFWPYWNVPYSIAKKEILPALDRAPRYLVASRMEIVGRGDRVLGDTLTPELRAGLEAGRYRLRQRPGPNNSVGLVKFAFPNRLNIYLHGTPETSAFRKVRRDLSHGCIRLEDPSRMAEWVLKGQPGWDRAHIDQVMADSTSIRVNISEPVGVLLYYTTAVALADGTIRFYHDIYGHDEALIGQLRRRS